MQLKKNRKLRASLTAATCSLLGTVPLAKVSAQEALPWQLDTAVLYYGEQNGRVKDTSFNALARKEFNDEHFLNLKVAIDSLTGASPTGALPSSIPQTFSTPSGGNNFTTAPGELPLDDSFIDTRVAINANWQQPWGELSTIDVGFHLSDEYDYTSLGLNARLARDFNRRNTTLSAGLAFASDEINPEGGVPIPLTSVPSFQKGNYANKFAGSKDSADLLLGISQILSRRMIIQVNYSFSYAEGYLNDPYKVLSAISPLVGRPILRHDGDELVPALIYEGRPNSRQKQSLFGRLKYRFDRGTLGFSYRYMKDDWKIDSSTVDLRYRWDLPSSSYIEPHVRFYTQTAAGFYTTSLIDGKPLPKFASADYRLGDFEGVTVGVKYGRILANGNEWNVRLESYSTAGNGPNSIVYPDLDAVIFQMSYNFALGGRRSP